MRKKAPFNRSDPMDVLLFGGDTITSFEAEDHHTHAKKSGSVKKARPTTKREVIVLGESNTFAGMYRLDGLIGLFQSSIPLSDKRKDSRKASLFKIYTFAYGDKDLELYLYRCWSFSEEQEAALKRLIAKEGTRIVASSYAQIDMTRRLNFEIQATLETN